MALNRFAWEHEKEKSAPDERRRSVLHFERVTGVKVSGLDRQDKEMILSLLTIIFEATDAPSGTIELVFAGDGAIRLEVECIETQLTDMPAAWAAKSRPNHKD